MYHPYVRPPTAEIIARIYPRRNGERTKVYPSGAALKGTVANEIFQVFFVDSGIFVYHKLTECRSPFPHPVTPPGLICSRPSPPP